MSFLRPGAVAALRRWAETGAWAALGTGGALWLFAAAGLASPWREGLALAALAAGLLLARSAALAALGARAARAPGVVSVAERRVAYFGPHQGGFVSLDEIAAIELWAADPAHWRHEAEWVLRPPAPEPALIVPVSAAGAGGLIDAFAALPGFSPERALAALRAPEGATVAIWARGGPAPRPALAGRAGAD